MKNQLINIALEGTCNGDVVGGLYREPRENLQALLFRRGNFRSKNEIKDVFLVLF
jgi:hypothetical protein